MNVDGNFTVHLGSSLRIDLVDDGRTWDTTAVEIIVPAVNLRSQLADGKITSGGSWAEIAIVDSPGKYRIRLDRTVVGGDDFEALGGSVANIAPRDRHLSDWTLSPLRFCQEKTADLKRLLGDCWGRCDHRILVYQNGQNIFDTANRPIKAPQGMTGMWQNCEFDIGWRPGDAILVKFEDWRSIMKDRVIFSMECKSGHSIEVLSGKVQGGKSGKSAVLFQATPVR